jgi:hypothetical protein
LSIDDGASYSIGGNGIKLGAGGLTASSSATSFGTAGLSLPITLQAPQTWTVDGNNSNNQVNLGVQTVSGASDALTINLTRQTALGIDRANVEVGPVTLTSPDTSSFNNILALNGGRVNAGDGQSVSLNGSGAGLFVAASSTTGPLTSTGGAIQVGNGRNFAANMAVHGGISLDTASAVTLNVVKPGTLAGTDYSQISATGAVTLAGSLRLAGATNTGKCPTLHAGNVDTLIKTTGALSGTFAGIPDGTIVSLSCFGGIQPTLRINYQANAVTGTVLTAGGVNTVTGVFPDAGSTTGGNTVTIDGTNFVNPASVKFGTTASSTVTFVSSTQLKAVVPPHASGVVDVTVTSSSATSVKSQKDLYAYGPPTVSSFSPTSGITGSSVTITGTNFVPRATVKFGTLTSPSVTFTSATQLKAVVPDGAVAAPISVSTAAGSGASSANFTPTLSITGFSPGAGPVGTTVTINGVGFNATSSVAFNGTPSSSVSFVSGHLQATVPGGATSGPITVTNTSGAVGTVRSSSNLTVG